MRRGLAKQIEAVWILKYSQNTNFCMRETNVFQNKTFYRYSNYSDKKFSEIYGIQFNTQTKKKLEENCNKYFIKIILKIWLPSFFLPHPSCALLDIYFWVTLFLKIELLTFCITRSWIFYTPVLLLIKITFL